jgi:mono/diheme cytochrome c family protein
MKLVRVLGLGVVCLVAFSFDVPVASQSSTVRLKPDATYQTVRLKPDATYDASAQYRALLDQYCVTCHNDRLRTAGITLEAASIADPAKSQELLEKVARKLRSRTMPPADSPRPDAPAYEHAAGQLEAVLDAVAAKAPNPGHIPGHRLNRAEYANAIRDLLALEIDGPSLLPADEANHGFDNIAGTLTLSPALLDRYMSAARRISRLAVGDPTIAPAFATKTYVVPKGLYQDDRMNEDLPFGSRGGLAVRHHFPLDGEYLIQVRLRKNLYDYVRGVREPHRLEVRLDGARIREFIVGGGTTAPPTPVSYAGNIPGSPEWEAYTLAADHDLDVRVLAKAGTHTLAVSFVHAYFEPEGVRQPPLNGFALTVDESSTNPSGTGGPAVENVTVAGPYDPKGPGDTASRRRIFICRPTRAAEEAACAKRILSAFARRAFRRPLDEDDVTTLDQFYEEGRRTAGFEAGIQRAIERVLVDPDFLFRIEGGSDWLEPNVASGFSRTVSSSAATRVADLDLASRLSFFLWSSVPDDELIDVAAKQRLRDPKVLEQQVRRMLADPRSKALVENFAGQWLGLRALRASRPDQELYPAFDENLREAFVRETELFVESQLRDDRGLADLLTANYTFVNERLARHYGIPGVVGTQFRRVTLATPERGGILGHGSILTMTSYPTRTSPVLRGHWLLENLLGAPPPPPPADVPGLRERNDAGQVLPLRARMEQHRTSPACAACHVRMDPLGFALENFDAIGRWRTLGESGAPIDASGSLPDGSRFNGFTGLRSFLLERRTEYVRTATEKMLTYALGRSVEYYDAPAVRRIVRDAGSTDYKWSSIILGIVKSTPFQQRRART